jgi:hypothetical protein
MTHNKPVTTSAARNVFLFAFLIFYTFSTSAQTTYSVSSDSDSYASVHYKGTAWISKQEQYRSCQYNLVNVIDSFLFIQINIAGIEIGKGLVTPTHILFINKVEKKYYQGDYSIFKHLTGFETDFHTLQAIINGFPVSLPEETEITYSGERFSKDEHSFFKTLTGKYGDFEIEIEVKKITFNSVPEVSAIVPKNYTQIIFDLHEDEDDE